MSAETVAASTRRGSRTPRVIDRLRRQAEGEYGFTGERRQNRDAIGPDAAMYGVFQPAYAAALAQPTGAVGGDILSRAALREGATNEIERYDAALAAANEQQSRLQRDDAFYNFTGAIGERAPEWTDRGATGDVERIEYDQDGRPFIVRDPVQQYAMGSEVLNTNQAERRGENANAVAALARAGIRTPPQTAADLMTSPWATEREVYGVWDQGQRTPEQATENFRVRERIDEGLTAEQQIELARYIAEQRALGRNEVEITEETSPGGVVYQRVQGNPAAMERYRQGRTNPNAGGQGAGPSATQGTVNRFRSGLAGLGYSAPVVAGFLGNAQVELPSWNPSARGSTGDRGTAHGQMQWRNERVSNFVRITGVHPSRATPEQTIRFIDWEMRNPRAAGMTTQQRDAILAARTPEEAADLIDRFYERSDGRHRARRRGYARTFFGQQDGANAGTATSLAQQASGGRQAPAARSAPRAIPAPSRTDNSAIIIAQARRAGHRAEAQADGTVLVTLRSGQQQRYGRDGRRIG